MVAFFGSFFGNAKNEHPWRQQKTGYKLSYLNFMKKKAPFCLPLIIILQTGFYSTLNN